MRLLGVDARFIEVEVQVRGAFACLVELTYPRFRTAGGAAEDNDRKRDYPRLCLKHSISTSIMKSISYLVLS